MKQAFILADNAREHDDVPIGAVIVRDGEIIASGENMVQLNKNPTLHAEIVAINAACATLGQKFLDDCEIYVTLEPCAMCATALSLARIRKIHFAAHDVKGGGIYHNARVYNNDLHLWKPEIIEHPEYAEQSATMLREFFQNKRKKV